MNVNRNYSNNNQEDEYDDDFETSIKYSTYENDFEEVTTTHNDSLYSVDFEQTSVKESPLNKLNIITKEKNSTGSLYLNDDFEQPSVKVTPNKSSIKDQNTSDSLYSNHDFESNSSLISKEIKNNSSINLNSTIVKPVRPVTACINTTIRKTSTNNNNSTAIITKADIIRSKSANNIRPLTSSANATTNKFRHNKQQQSTKSPKSNNNNSTNQTNNNTNNDNIPNNNLKFKLNSLPPWCFPSRTIPKDLADHLFGVNNKESYVKISLFCKHNKV